MIEFRNRGIFYEAVTNQILDDLVAACQPRRMTVVGDFSVRGGIKTVVTASHDYSQRPTPNSLNIRSGLTGWTPWKLGVGRGELTSTFASR